MPFKKMEKPKYPPRLWALVGFPGSGKSTFAAQMRGPLLPIDADQRFIEVRALTDSEVYKLSDVAADNGDPEQIAALLAANMPGTQIGTIVVDSLTTIIAPLVTRAVIDNDAGRNKNRMAGFKDKALAMRMLQDAVSKWGTDCLWIYHLQEGRDAEAKKQTTATVSRTELARLMRSLNLQLEIVQDGARRGVKVAWARRGRAHPEVPVLWDDSGKWAGMPEKVEAAVYAGLSEQERQAIEQRTPTSFASPEAAIAWGVERGAFRTIQHARNAYDKLKREQTPQSAEDMAALWAANVEYRRASGQKDEDELAAEDPAPAPSPEEVLEHFFPRDAPEATPDAVDANAFWTEFYALKAQDKLANAERLRNAAEIKQAQQSGDWNTALRWLRTQVR
ncbi:MAG: AAA family ATPase [Anaerolineae bacterium]|nr:AAA family ATPase [Anaerolineae bacterium]